jgi:hypothetical protein
MPAAVVGYVAYKTAKSYYDRRASGSAEIFNTAKTIALHDPEGKGSAARVGGIIDHCQKTKVVAKPPKMGVLATAGLCLSGVVAAISSPTPVYEAAFDVLSYGLGPVASNAATYLSVYGLSGLTTLTTIGGTALLAVGIVAGIVAATAIGVYAYNKYQAHSHEKSNQATKDIVTGVAKDVSGRFSAQGAAVARGSGEAPVRETGWRATEDGRATAGAGVRATR